MHNLVLLVSGVLLLLSLRNLYASPAPFNIVAGWIGMAMFAGMATFLLWLQVDIDRSSKPVYYGLPTGSPTNEVVIRKLGMIPGFRGRLVLKQDRRSAGPPLARFKDCRWTLIASDGREIREGSPRSEDELFDLEERLDHLTLRYTVTVETRPLLEQVDLEVSAPTVPYYRHPSYALGFARMYMGGYLLALMIAASGVMQQRRRMRKLAATPPPPVS